MIKKFNLLSFIFAIIVLFNFYGCSPAGILAGGGATTMVVAEGDKSVGTVVDDASIKLNISALFLEAGNSLFLDIDVQVNEGRVLLTGIVETQESRINAIKTVWQVEGVKEVINEIEIGDKTTIKEYANDLWINTQIKTKSARQIGLKALTYNFETIKGKVYIAGVSSRPEEIESLIENIKTVKGVKEIVNYVVMKE